MKILHIFPFTIFAINYIQGFSIDKTNNHFFLLYGYQRDSEKKRNIIIEESPNIIKDSNDSYEQLSDLYNLCDVFVISCVPENLKLCRILHQCYLNEPKPFVIDIWGREIYKSSDIYKLPNKDTKEVDQLKTFFIEKCNFITGGVADYEYMTKNYKINCEFVHFNALFGFSTQDYTFPINVKEKSKKNILVGHRGTETSRHTEILISLKDSKINIHKIICPLSYGNKEYINVVDKLGRKLFGFKWHPIKKWIKKEIYYEYLYKKVDIAIFNNSESEGANTILALIYMGKKVYISKDNAPYRTLEELGVIFYEWTGKINDDFFQQLNKKQVEHNRKIMENYGNKQNIIKEWNIIFRKCLGK